MQDKDNIYVNNKKVQIKTLFLLGIILIAGIMLFLLTGMNFNNFSFNFPRRVNKIAAIIVVSYSIGYSSIVFQTITNNKILTPGVMGLDSLYMFIQTVVVFFFGARQLTLMSDESQFFISTGIMVSASLLLYVLLFRGESRNIYFLILIGMVLGGFFSGLSNFMQVIMDPNEFLILQGKMFASFNNVNVNLINICLVISAVCMLITIPDMKKLDVVSLGEHHAVNLGVNYRRLVKKTFIVISVLVSVSTVLVGPVIFLGILVANLSREIIKGYRHSLMIAGAFFIGGIALIYSLLIVERIFGFGTTTSIVINLVGGIYFLYLVLKENSLKENK